jgi:hypothetical protein
VRIYVDTSVIRGCLDEEFSAWSLRLMKEFHAGGKTAVISDITRSELDKAPGRVKEALGDLLRSRWEAVSLDDDAKRLANAYVHEGIVRMDCLTDALHIAVATLARVDVLVSWNFKHIVNLRRIHLYNAVNLKEGCGMIDIRTPPGGA